MKLPATDRATLTHTPGPWTVTGDGSVHVSVPTGEHTARLVTLARGMSDANARLIAAAPDMFSAGTALLATLDPDTLNPEQFNGGAT
jgi:hypothetical protein